MATTKALELGQFGTDLTVDDSTGAVTIANTVNSNTFSSTGIDDSAASTALYITANNDVGIGESNPSDRLEVREDVAGSARIVINNQNASGLSTLRFTNAGGAAAAIYENTSNSFTLQNATNSGTIRIQTTSSGGTTANAITIDGDQNVELAGELRGPSLFIIDPATYDTDSDAGSAAGTVRIRGDLIVDGDTTTINSTTLTVDDLNIVLASGAADSATADGAGITVDGANATLTYDGTNDKWDFNKKVAIQTNFQVGRISSYNDITGVYGSLDDGVSTTTPFNNYDHLILQTRSIGQRSIVLATYDGSSLDKRLEVVSSGRTYAYNGLEVSGSTLVHNTQNSSTPLILTRQGSLNESLRIHVDDGAAHYNIYQDEANTGHHKFFLGDSFSGSDSGQTFFAIHPEANTNVNLFKVWSDGRLFANSVTFSKRGVSENARLWDFTNGPEGVIICNLAGYDADGEAHDDDKAIVLQVYAPNVGSGSSHGSATYLIQPNFGHLSSPWSIRQLDGVSLGQSNQFSLKLTIYGNSAAPYNQYLVAEGLSGYQDTNSEGSVRVIAHGIGNSINLDMEVIDPSTDSRVTGANITRNETIRYDDRYIRSDTNQTITNTLLFDTDTTSRPIYVTRQGSTSESLAISVGDGNANFIMTQDEDNFGGMYFKLDVSEGSSTNTQVGRFVFANRDSHSLLEMDANGFVKFGHTNGAYGTVQFMQGNSGNTSSSTTNVVMDIYDRNTYYNGVAQYGDSNNWRSEITFRGLQSNGSTIHYSSIINRASGNNFGGASSSFARSNLIFATRGKDVEGGSSNGLYERLKIDEYGNIDVVTGDIDLQVGSLRVGGNQVVKSNGTHQSINANGTLAHNNSVNLTPDYRVTTGNGSGTIYGRILTPNDRTSSTLWFRVGTTPRWTAEITVSLADRVGSPSTSIQTAVMKFMTGGYSETDGDGNKFSTIMFEHDPSGILGSLQTNYVTGTNSWAGVNSGNKFDYYYYVGIPMSYYGYSHDVYWQINATQGLDYNWFCFFDHTL